MRIRLSRKIVNASAPQKDLRNARFIEKKINQNHNKCGCNFPHLYSYSNKQCQTMKLNLLLFFLTNQIME